MQINCGQQCFFQAGYAAGPNCTCCGRAGVQTSWAHNQGGMQSLCVLLAVLTSSLTKGRTKDSAMQV